MKRLTIALTTIFAFLFFASQAVAQNVRTVQSNQGVSQGEAALLGAIAGSAIGLGVSNRGNQTEGALIGAAVGALGGAIIQGNSHNRTPLSRNRVIYPRYNVYYRQPYGYSYNRGYNGTYIIINNRSIRNRSRFNNRRLRSIRRIGY